MLMRIYDISQEVFACEVYPGDPAPKKEVLCSIAKGELSPPWDSPGKNPGVGCHFLLHCMKVKSESEVA